MKSLKSICFIMIILVCFSAQAQELKTIKLPAPQTSIGKPLMETLKLRRTSRNFDTISLPMQELSNLLWAAFGVNRPESGKRTAPSAMNWQEIEIYVAVKDGCFIYNAKEHSLKMVLTEDIRGATGKQEFVKSAPVNLIYVSDYSKVGKATEEDKIIYTSLDAGFIAQNVYLYCASQNLAVVFRGMVDRISLAKILKLRPEQRVVASQTVGYEKK